MCYPTYDFLPVFISASKTFSKPTNLVSSLLHLGFIPFHLLKDFCFENCAPSYTLSIFPSLLHPALTDAILKKKKKKVSFDLTSSSDYHFILCSCSEKNFFLKNVCWFLSQIPQQHTLSLKCCIYFFASF